MRIAFLTPEFVTETNFSGGLANYLFRTCLALKSFGHYLVVFVISDKEEIFFLKGIEIHQLQLRTPVFIKIIDRVFFNRISKPLSFISSALTISKALNREHVKHPFDIVHVPSYQAAGLFIKHYVPSVVRISSFEPLWRKAYEKPLNLSQRLVEFIETLALKKADGIFSPSQRIASKVAKSVNLKVDVIEPPFLIDTQNINTSVYKRDLDRKAYLLFFGTIGLMKGCKTIADILEPLLAGYPELLFVFIGASSDYNGRPMMDYIWEKAGSKRDRVIHYGPMDHEKLYPIIKNAQGVILPSRIDNFPNTCVEAMYFGQIVIGTRDTSFEQLIEDGVSGFLCQPDDPDDLLEQIRKIMNLKKTARNIISQNARNRIKNLAPEKTIENLIKFYQAVISKHSFYKWKNK